MRGPTDPHTENEGPFVSGRFVPAIVFRSQILFFFRPVLCIIDFCTLDITHFPNSKAMTDGLYKDCKIAVCVRVSVCVLEGRPGLVLWEVYIGCAFCFALLFFSFFFVLLLRLAQDGGKVRTRDFFRSCHGRKFWLNRSGHQKEKKKSKRRIWITCWGEFFFVFLLFL